jgi:SAM-dependent methyltransferase
MSDRAEQQSSSEIRAVPCPHCVLCGSEGVSLYDGLSDRLFSAPGKWNLRRCLNTKCELIWLDPMPMVEDIHIAYRNYHTHEDESPPSAFPYRFYNAVRYGYLRHRFGYTKGVGARWYQFLSPLAYLHPAGSDHAKAAAMFLPAPRVGARLLDVGCGNGYGLKRMFEMGWQAVGTEVDAAAVKVAHLRGLTVHYGELNDQHFPDDSFDAIHLGNVIEHVPNPLTLLQECRRILRPAGRLVILTPNAASWGHRHFGEDWRGLEPPRHLHLFNPQSMRLAVEFAGFPLEQVGVFTRMTEVLYLSTLLKKARESSEFWVGRGKGMRSKMKQLSWQIWERALLLANSEAGDEIVAITKK